MKTAIAGSLVLSLAAGVAFAQNTPPPAAGAGQGASAMVEFGSIDKDKDGRLSSAEAQANTELRTAFSTLDADRDSYLSQTEYGKWSKAAKPGPSSQAPAAPRSESSDASEAAEPAGAAQ
jgi:hypothetical protein